MPRFRDIALRVWTKLPGRSPLLCPPITDDLLLAWKVELNASAVTRYKIRTLEAPVLTNDLATLSRPHIDEYQLLRQPDMASLEFDPFCPSCHIIGKHFAQRPNGQRTLPQTDKEGWIKYEPKRKRIPLPRPKSDFLWDTILLLLQPPLDLALSRIVDLPHKLYPFQIPGIKFLAETRPGALLGDDMGLGKTIQAIVALRLLFQTGTIRRALVICPRSILPQWEKELEKWAPLLRVATVYGPAYERRGYWHGESHIYLTTYGTMRQDIDEIVKCFRDDPGSRFDVVVLDEISTIKNPSSKQSQAAKALPKRRGWGLSGTPLENRPDDVIAEFGFLHPKLFAGATNPSPREVRDRIQPYFMRRRKQEVLKDLLPITYTERWMELTREQRDAYDSAYETGVVDLKEKREQVTVTHVLALLTKLKQICNVDPRTRTSAKIEWLHENLEQMTQDNDKMLIFSQWLGSGVDEIYEHLPKHQTLKYIGKMSTSQREAAKGQFSEDPEKKTLLLTYGAGKHGLNLQAANYVVLFDHWWNPATAQQAVDRTHRIGQTNKVFVYDLWVENTIEERIYQILERKRQLFGEVIDSLAVRGVSSTGLSEEELFGLFDLTPPRREREKKEPAVDDLLRLSPGRFEELTAEIYRKRGYNARVTPSTRDEGIDVVAYKEDALNPECIAIQCKNHAAPVGRPDAQKLLGAATDPKYSQAILVATAGFTEDCREFARKQGRLKLVDGDYICSLISDLGMALSPD